MNLVKRGEMFSTDYRVIDSPGIVTVKPNGKPPVTYRNVGRLYLGPVNVTVCHENGKARKRFRRVKVTSVTL